MKKIFLDTNIFIDVLLGRDVSTVSIRSILPYLEKGMVYMSALSVHITYYILKIKQGSDMHKRASDLIGVINLIPLSETIVNLSLYNFLNDFEDCIQYNSALNQKCNYILTRDTKDFTKIQKNIPCDIEIINTLENIL